MLTFFILNLLISAAIAAYVVGSTEDHSFVLSNLNIEVEEAKEPLIAGKVFGEDEVINQMI